MSKREAIHEELTTLYNEGAKLTIACQKKEEEQFQYDYQRWYTKVLKVVASLALDRHAEFRSYYEIDPKRKSLGYGAYVIQDYLKGIAPNSYQHPNFNTREQVLTCSFNQLTINLQYLSPPKGESIRFLRTLRARSTPSSKTTRWQSPDNR
jgi:hypothetical protein